MKLLQVFKTFLFTAEKGDIIFSTKKFYALIFCSIGIYSYISLLFWPASHWVAKLISAGVPESVTVAAIGSLDALILGALAVYGWTKTKGV